MNKKLLVSLMLMSPLVYADAEHSPFSTDLRGVHVVPLAKQNIPEQVKKEILFNLSKKNAHDYEETDGKNVQFLLNIKKTAPYQFKATHEKDYGVYDTHLKSSYKQLKLYQKQSKLFENHAGEKFL